MNWSETLACVKSMRLNTLKLMRVYLDRLGLTKRLLPGCTKSINTSAQIYENKFDWKSSFLLRIIVIFII